jgi:hypothetical protein
VNEKYKDDATLEGEYLTNTPTHTQSATNKKFY